MSPDTELFAFVIFPDTNPRNHHLLKYPGTNPHIRIHKAEFRPE